MAQFVQFIAKWTRFRGSHTECGSLDELKKSG